CGSKGTEALIVSGPRAEAAIVLEPTELMIVHAHRGWAWGRVTVHGHAAHGSRPQVGIDAIVHAAPVLAGIGALQRDLDTRPHPVVGAASVHAGLIRGGAEMSTYPAVCEIDVERRNIPGEDASTLEAELHAIAARVEPPARAEVATSFGRSALLTAVDEPIVAALRSAGPDLSIGAATFWTDAALLSEAGIPAVVFGPGGGGIHETEEWLDLASFDIFQRVLWTAVQSFCA
ncbi:MAG TPA: M20/M25/M40 family metallo-hydrolase, partial [Ilumatobacteraceae bacterium]